MVTGAISAATYPNLWGYPKDLHQQPGAVETVDLVHVRGYYVNHKSINLTGIVPKGPSLDYNEPHNSRRSST